ncbi:SDR family oxidoreductase [Bacillus sp. NEB1478]|uniref:SDR family oxidoreductase n=1 Tax=Bacillus sp. NEB1478 TaxID=3073816 RepID=UPI002873CD73|nr:SDR family oxidoreductase [Bacillus sp. NEB1478]WNB91087.1 SDR family oxidoreductase [Bacillus sp. NEB1478]
MNAKFLVIGGTGNIGKELTKLLAKNGQKVRVSVRPSSKTEELKALGVELVHADLQDQSSLKEAMNGIEKVFFAAPFVPNMVELSLNIVQAAKEAGVKHLIKISGAGAELETITVAKWHSAIEKEMEQSGIAYTFLRPNSFMQNIVNFSSHTIRDHGTIYAPIGDGKVALVDARDVAKVAYSVLTEVGHENKAYYLSGPEAISYHKIADVLTSVTGKPVQYIDVPAEGARQFMVEAGMPTEIVDALIELYHINKLGYTAEVSETIEKVTGQKAASFESFAKDYKDAFIG